MSLPRIAGWLLVGVAVAACAGAMTLHFEIGLNSDNQLHLQQTLRWLQGRSLYTALVMPSPPMSFVLYAPVAAANLAGGLPMSLGFDLWTSALLAASLLLCRHVLVSIPLLSDRLARALILTLIAAGLVILPLRDNVFGERDHLFALLFAPYLLLQSPSGATASLSRPSRALIGLAAAIGLGIKPYFLAIWGLQQLYWMLRERSPWRVLRRLETRVACGALAAYAVAIAVLTPEYLHSVAPMAFASYPAISPPFVHRTATLVRIWIWIVALPLAASALLLLRGERPAQRDLVYGLCLCVGASLSGFAGGWHYTWYPLYLLAFVFCANVIGALFAAARDFWPGSAWRALACGLAGSGLIAMPVTTQLLLPARERGAIDVDHQRRTGFPRGQQRFSFGVEQFFERHLHVQGERSFLLLGNGIWDSRLAAFDPARVSVSRFYALWPLPALVAARSEPERAAQTGWIRRYLLDAATEDLRVQKPDVVFVERSLWMWGLPRSFDVLGYFLRDPAFAQAWRGYARVESIDDCALWPNFCAFDVYYRGDLVR